MLVMVQGKTHPRESHKKETNSSVDKAPGLKSERAESVNVGDSIPSPTEDEAYHTAHDPADSEK